MGILVGILILSLMMIVHELGHFLVGRKLGFKVIEFSIFMGPRLFTRIGKDGTRYSLKLLPIGASVQFAGEYPEDQETDDSDPSHFYNRPRWARALTIATGPATNWITGILAFLILFLSVGYTLPVIARVNPGSQAEFAGLRAGDRIVAIDGQPVRTIIDVQGLTAFIPVDQPLSLVVRNPEGTQRQLDLQPATVRRYRLAIQVRFDDQKRPVIERVEQEDSPLRTGDILLSVNDVASTEFAAMSAAVNDSAGEEIVVALLRDGIRQEIRMRARPSDDPAPRGVLTSTYLGGRAFGTALSQAIHSSWSIIRMTLRSVGAMIRGQVRAQDTLSGPVGVVAVISEVVAQPQDLGQKLDNLLFLFALISVSLGFMNLLPIPPLDGNHLILLAVETIRGKRLSVRIQNAIGIVGFALIILLALAGLYFDVLRLAGK